MKIIKIEIENFRLLKNISIDIKEELSLIIGKNNTGKTSLLTILDKFLNFSDNIKFKYDDFNLNSRIKFEEFLNKNLAEEKEFSENALSIKMNILIKYDETSDLSNLNEVIMDLDPNNKFVFLGFELNLKYSDYKTLLQDLENDKIENKTTYLQNNFSRYFKTARKSYRCTPSGEKDENDWVDIEAKTINKIINFKYISAKREVNNKDKDKRLSFLSGKLYNRDCEDLARNPSIESFKKALNETDDKLNEQYKEIFKNTIKNVKDFGIHGEKDSIISIRSTLEHRQLLSDNTTVYYQHSSDGLLPEHYNGLGYMNLICMIFEIELKLKEFQRTQEEKIADINLLFIEEPEAHTHPQMQYVFIKNIKKFLERDGKNLQTIITSHSAHIVSNCDFEDIKYLKKEDDSNVISKNLKELKELYDQDKDKYGFLKQYLTLNKAEVFFADKLIFVEGTTERLLLPAMMKKIDKTDPDANANANPEDKAKELLIPLLSQNISIIDIGGAYIHIFDEFIEFLGLKTLIITDLDSTKESVNPSNSRKTQVACRVTEGTSTSNSTLKHYFPEVEFNELKDKSFDDKILPKNKARIAYQTDENEYTARSFEDAFININKNFFLTQEDGSSAIVKKGFKGIKNKTLFTDKTKDSYDLANDCILKKSYFAMDILFNGGEDFKEWKTPAYIKEALIWLKKD